MTLKARLHGGIFHGIYHGIGNRFGHKVPLSPRATSYEKRHNNKLE
jgi:hypothetical protein